MPSQFGGWQATVGKNNPNQKNTLSIGNHLSGRLGRYCGILRMLKVALESGLEDVFTLFVCMYKECREGARVVWYRSMTGQKDLVAER